MSATPTTELVPVEPTPSFDPFFFDLDRLRGIASDAVVRRGLQYLKDNCVIDIGWDGGGVWATVKGVSLNSYEVEITLDDAGQPLFDCTCPFEQEPVCKHVVATLLSYAAHQAVPEESVQTATEQARAERVKSAHTEVTVEHVSGDPWFGTWRARSVRSTGAALRPYRVVIRSVDERLNTCTCPDFEYNRLGTCKHIEAVVTRARKRVRNWSNTQGMRTAVVYLDWDAPDAPRVRVRRPPRLDASIAEVVNRHFDTEGFLKGQLPGAWFELESELSGIGEVSLGEDAANHARRLAEDALHRQRAADIRAEWSRVGPLVPGMRLPLLPYQLEGAAFLAAKGRALLADDMGLGKTAQAIAAAHWLIQHEGVRRVLVVAPTSNKKHWVDEVRKFTNHAALVVDGSPKARERAYASDVPFLVVHYETVRADQAWLCEKYPADVLILDEAQRIKNWRTLTAAVIKALPARFVFALSGTPLENRLEELYSLMQRVDGRVLGPLWRFRLDFIVTDERGRELTYRNLGELRRRLSTVMLRRDRAVIADQLPARTDQALLVPMTAHQQELHDAAVAAAGQFAHRAKSRKLTAAEEKLLMAALQRARMACDAAGLVDKSTEGSPKLDEFARLIETLCLGEHRKVVVFSQWELMTRMACQVLDQLGVGYCNLHGGVPAKSRPNLLERFDTDPEAMVFVSTDAGATGLNLQVASAIIVLDLPWNPAILDQRIARIHRMRQQRNVLVVLLIAENSYEERVAALIEGKRGLFAATMGDEDARDVVGVSKKTLAIALEALESMEENEAKAKEQTPRESEGAHEVPALAALADAETSPDSRPAEQELDDRPPFDVAPPQDAAPEGEPLPEADEVPDVLGLAGREEPEPNVDPALGAIEALSKRLAPVLEEVLVARGGIVAVVNAVSSEATVAGNEIAAAFKVEVAVLDVHVWATLRRLGKGSPLGETEQRWKRPSTPATPPPSPHREQARRKLQGARVLIGGGCDVEAVRLVADALTLELTARAERAEVVSPSQLAQWLYGELVPKGLATSEEATLLLQLRGLQDAEALPAGLVGGLVDAVGRAVG